MLPWLLRSVLRRIRLNAMPASAPSAVGSPTAGRDGSAPDDPDASRPSPSWASSLEMWAVWRDPFAVHLPPLAPTTSALGNGDDPMRETDPDRGGSARIRAAARLLLEGRDRTEVARITGVPEALLEMIETELAQQRQREAGDRGGDEDLRGAAGRDVLALEHFERLLDLHRQQLRRQRGTIVAVVIIEAAAAANIVASITSLFEQSVKLSVLTGIVAVALVLAVWLLARSSTTPTARGDSPRSQSSTDGSSAPGGGHDSNSGGHRDRSENDENGMGLG